MKCRALTDDEIRDILGSFDGPTANRDKALFVLGIKSGFRISELLSLTIGDVFKGEKVSDHVTVHAASMKGKRAARTVILNPAAKDALAVLVDEMRGKGFSSESFLFRSREGGNRPISRIQAWRLLRTVYEANNIVEGCGAHSLRKSFAVRVHAKLGNDIFRTQKAMGHKNVNSTVQYLSLGQAEIDTAIMEL